MAAGRDDRFRFSGLEMAVIAGSFAVTALLVFILGFYVGRDVASRHCGPEPLTARVPVGLVEEKPPGRAEESRATIEAAEPEAAVRIEQSYTVQVRATRRLKEAESLAAKLAERGMDSFVALAGDEGARWYRVRVGKFDSMAAARLVAERCRQEFKLEQTYVTRY